MKAAEVLFQGLLNGKIQYRVPLFQRTYSWKEENWQCLWDNLLEIYVMKRRRSHFIGAIVTLPMPDAPENVNKYMLIDGQQRLTTLLVLLSVIKENAKDIKGLETLSEQIHDECLKNKFAKKEEEKDKLIPTQVDHEALKSVLDGSQTDATNNGILDVQSFFKKMIAQGDLEGNSIDLQQLKICITDYISLVSITLDQEDSPHRIFESLNNTGMALTASDLVRNYAFMQIAGDDKRLNEVYQSSWLPMQKRTEDENGVSHLSDFFWRFLMKDGDLPRYDEVYEVMRSWIDDQQNKGMSIGEITEQLNRYSQFYVKLWLPAVHEKNSDISKQMDRINQWEVDVSYPFLLTVMDEREEGNIDDKKVLTILKMIESYIVRRAICGVPTNRLRRIFARMSKKVTEEQNDKDFIQKTKEYLMNNEWPTDGEFHEKFQKARIYFSSRLPRTRLILSSLEHSFEHHEPIQMDSQVTIEHLMPQVLSDEWIEHLGDDAEQIHAAYLHTIGNLTYSGYNTEMGNELFDNKKETLKNSHFEMNRQITQAEKWTKDEIEKRAEQMADRAITIWSR